MQVNSINLTNYQQNFGMAIKVNENAVKILSRKLGTQKNINKFEELFNAQAENPFNVHITKDLYSETLCGYVADGSTYYNGYNGKGTFQSTIKWIEEMCQDANNQFEIAKIQKFLETILNK